MNDIHICSFSALDIPRGKRNDYEAVKAALLAAGRFSIFEATDTAKMARLFDRLSKDPELEFVTLQFPWTAVKRRDAPFTPHPA